ncbi:RsmB/NOP family class I SAM-dependent RNA methyltransferase [Lichenifustis flavocetrariae]|uniref:Methyltransferase domain-containing protein n=1 Tax=Lichenifustis flavocetrariae TaxID=2949735 RepID=A0AA41YYK7_9HYPH|nr:transcription antitermination factor NusB [Lichenifustis flavocetrariae]MCW6509463.1 methyltransferase domain-containing protein [Lichenifustis flavocetrariae]
MSKSPVTPQRPASRAKPWSKKAQDVPPTLPPGLPARLAAASVLADVIGSGHGVDEFFSGEPVHPRLAGLEPRDRALVRSIVMVSLRRLGTIRKALASLLERGLPRKSGPLEWTLITTAAQLLFLDVPDHAAVNLCVQAVRHDPQSLPFASLANAVARNLARLRETLTDTDPLIDTPAWLAARWRLTYGDGGVAQIAAANRVEPRLDITVKSDPEGWAERLDGDVLAMKSIRLRGHTPVPELPGYEDGAWWVQDAAAALPARLLGAEWGERVADLCAAPGGKTAQLAMTGAQVVAVDRSAERLKRLAINMERLNLSAETKVADITTYEAAPFDAILLDAPCSATGTMRRHPDVGWTKRISDISTLAALQAKMLDRAVSLLRPGGRMVYCVCSIEPEEGEAQIAALLRRNPDINLDPIRADEIAGESSWLTAKSELRTLPYFNPSAAPGLEGMDGFYAARLLRRH